MKTKILVIEVQDDTVMALTKKLSGLDVGMSYYSNLEKDEDVIAIVFAESLYITSSLIVEQLPGYLEALKKLKCIEVLDIDLDVMTSVKYWMRNYKLKYDMEALNDLTLHERSIEFAYKGFKPKTTLELYQAIERNIIKMVEMLTEVQRILTEAPAGLYENFYLSQKAACDAKPVKARYKQWKREVGVVTPELLKDKGMQELVDLLTKKVMRHASEPSNREIEQVDLEALKQHMVRGYEFPSEFPNCYARFRRFIKEGDTLTINYDCYGKYLYESYYKLTPAERRALIEFDIMLDLIHQDMPEITSQSDGTISTEDRIRQSIALLMKERYIDQEKDEPLFNQRNHWQAIYRILVDKGYCCDSDFDGFEVFIKRVMPNQVNQPYKKDSVRNINKTDFNKPLDRWQYDPASFRTRKPYERMVAVATRFKAILEENGL